MIRRMLIAVMVIAAITISLSAQAGERDLIAKSEALVASEVSGLSAPDAKFVLASQDMTKTSVKDLDSSTIVGDQGNKQIVQRSSGCSTGCSTGCSSGCSYGCSSGCSYGCSSGCSVGCR